MSTNGDRRPEQIEEEISRTRAEMSDTLDAIQRKLSPGQMLDQALHYLRDGPGDYFTHLGDAVKRNPLPVAMMGLSMGWLALANRHKDDAYYTSHYGAEFGGRGAGHSAGDSGGGIGDRLRKAGEHLPGMGKSGEGDGDGGMSAAGDKLKGMGEGMQDKGHDLAARGQQGLQSAREQAGRWGESMRGQSARARQGLDQLMDEQPLVLGVVGLAVGAALGAIIPGSRQEDELMGEMADDLRHQAREFGEQQLEKAEHVAERAGEAVSEQTRKETGIGAEGGGAPRPH